MWTRGDAALPVTLVWRARGTVIVTWSVEGVWCVEITTANNSAVYSILKMTAA